jgi:2-amino-4-hydroxy-6-hydroxymethyldihydropteridine diphosphokinase
MQAQRPRVPEPAVIDASAADAARAGTGAAYDAAPGAVRAYIGLGANLGDPVGQLRSAVAALAGLPGTTVVAVSSVWRSAPVGYLDQPDFCNAVAALDTCLSPQALLEALLAVEQAGGRTREFRNAPRLIDLDLLLYGDRIVDEPHLVVPHPRMVDRAFVLLPLAELAPGCIVPGAGPVSALAAAVQGQAIERVGALVTG